VFRQHPTCWRASLTIAFVFIVDQLSKYLIRHLITPGSSVRLLPGVVLVRAQNSGVLLRLLSSHETVVIILSSGIIIGVIIYLACNHRRRYAWLACGLIIGGAISNLTEHVRSREVTDFIALPLNFPIFNLADTAVVIGACILFLLIATTPLPVKAAQTEQVGASFR
jgi:signal peptidase II